jgi:C-terminal peptidase prc
MKAIDREFKDKISVKRWQEIVDKGLAAMAKELNDPYTAYLDNAAWKRYYEQMTASFAGIGAVLDLEREQKAFERAVKRAATKAGIADTDSPEAQKLAAQVTVNYFDGLRIKRVQKDSPALKAGVEPGDLIVALDGHPVAGQPVDDVNERLRGQLGAPIRLTVSRGGRNLELTAIRGEVNLPIVASRMLAPKIGYVYFAEFATDAEGQVIDAIRALRRKGAEKVVIDLRSNPGGDVQTVHGILASLLPAGLQTYTFRQRGKVVQGGKTTEDGPFAGMEKIVLVNGQSASGSELTATTLQDYGVKVVGPSRSYGKYSFQHIVTLPESSDPAEADAGLRVTAGGYFSGKGRSFPGAHDPKTGRNIPGSGGVTPDVIVPMTKKQETALADARKEWLEGGELAPAADPVLDKAVELLRDGR